MPKSAHILEVTDLDNSLNPEVPGSPLRGVKPAHSSSETDSESLIAVKQIKI